MLLLLRLLLLLRKKRRLGHAAAVRSQLSLFSHPGCGFTLLLDDAYMCVYVPLLNVSREGQESD